MSIAWFKSTYSGSEKTCVEVAHQRDAVLIRDSKYTGPADEQPIVSVPSTQWNAFLHLVLSTNSEELAGVSVLVHEDGAATLAGQGAALVYNADEWDAFIKGVADGEFDRN